MYRNPRRAWLLASCVLVAACSDGPLTGPAAATRDQVTQPAGTDRPPPASGSRILVDASRDGGVWWFPQWDGEGGYDPAQWHQGMPLAAYLRTAGFDVVELPRPFVITPALLDSFAIVIRAGAYGSYAPGEIAAYREYLRGGGRLLLAADHMALFTYAADGLANALGLRFAGVTRGENVMFFEDEHPLVAGAAPLRYMVGSGLLSWPDSALILGRLSDRSWLDRNNDNVQDPDEPAAPAVLGVMRYGDGRVVFAGDVNFWETVPQPLTDNALRWLTER